MRFRIYMATAIVALAALLMGPLQQWPASTVKFDDGRFLQDRYDDRCANASMFGVEGSSSPRTFTANNQFVPMEYLNSVQSVVYDPRSCWTEAATDTAEYIYSCSDGLSREFSVTFITSALAFSGPTTVRTFFGVHAGGAVVDGDEDETIIYEVTIPNFNWRSVVTTARLSLNDGDHVAFGYKALAGAPQQLGHLGYELSVIEAECYSDTET